FHHRLWHRRRRGGARRPEKQQHIPVHGSRCRGERLDRHVTRGAWQRARRNDRRTHARHDRNSFGRLYRHDRTRFFLLFDPHPHSSLSADGPVWNPHCRAKMSAVMFGGLIDNYTQSILIFTGINIIAAYSFFAPFKTGQVSLGQAGFMAVGAYCSAVLTQKFAVPFALALPVAGLFAGIVGVVLGFPALRIKGIYLLL